MSKRQVWSSIMEIMKTFFSIFPLTVALILLFFTIMFFASNDFSTPEHFFKQNHKALVDLVHQIEGNPQNYKNVLRVYNWDTLKCSNEKKKLLKENIRVSLEHGVTTIKINVVNYMFGGYAFLLYKSDDSLPTNEELMGSKKNEYKKLERKWFSVSID